MPLTSLRFARDPRLQKASDNNPPMKRGESGEPVATVQRAFVDLGFDMPVTTGNGCKLADGIFGAETEQVVRQFQKINGLDVDGVVGRQTLKKLEDLTNAQTATDRAKLAASTRLDCRPGPDRPPDVAHIDLARAGHPDESARKLVRVVDDRFIANPTPRSPHEREPDR